MRNSFAFSVVLAAAILVASPTTAHAALTQQQLDTLVTMLTAFGEDPAVIQAIRTALGATSGFATTGSLQFSAGAQPAELDLKPGTTTIPFTTLTLTNSSGAAVTVYSLNIERSGSSSDSNLKNIYLTNGSEVLATASSLDARHQAALTPTNLVLANGQTVTLTVAADISTKKSRNKTVQLSIVAVNTSSPVLGSLPVAGAKHTIR